MTVPKWSGTALGAVAVVLELPMFLTLFVVRDSVPFLTALALFVPAPYLGAGGLVLALTKRSRLGVSVAALSLGGLALVLLVFWALASALGQG